MGWRLFWEVHCFPLPKHLVRRSFILEIIGLRWIRCISIGRYNVLRTCRWFPPMVEERSYRDEGAEANAALFFALWNTNTETYITFFIKCVWMNECVSEWICEWMSEGHLPKLPDLPHHPGLIMFAAVQTTTLCLETTQNTETPWAVWAMDDTLSEVNTS